MGGEKRGRGLNQGWVLPLKKPEGEKGHTEKGQGAGPQSVRKKVLWGVMTRGDSRYEREGKWTTFVLAKGARAQRWARAGA